MRLLVYGMLASDRVNKSPGVPRILSPCILSMVINESAIATLNQNKLS